jgi:hypothetical protein
MICTICSTPLVPHAELLECLQCSTCSMITYDMECPICLEPITTFYKLTGCSHILCMKCARRCKWHSNENPITVESTFDLSIYFGVKKCIKCPLCRAVETKMTLDEFEYLYPDLFRDWTHSELTWNELTWGYDPEPEPKQKQKKLHYKFRRDHYEKHLCKRRK